MHIETTRLRLVAQTRAAVQKWVDEMRPQEKAHLSDAWLGRLQVSTDSDPWVHGFVIENRATGESIGKCGFTGPPEADGVVEIAYGIDPPHQGNGYATEAAAALVGFAFKDRRVQIARAHTLPQGEASKKVLLKCGFQFVGEFMDPQDGLVWRWQKRKL